jgi:hypothetical protein
MSGNDEIRGFLDYLVDHERDCARENCPVCQSARNVYESVRNVIFSDVSYPNVTITARRESAQAIGATGASRKSAKKAA